MMDFYISKETLKLTLERPCWSTDFKRDEYTARSVLRYVRLILMLRDSASLPEPEMWEIPHDAQTLFGSALENFCSSPKVRSSAKKLATQLGVAVPKILCE
jgi:hypothetical protein